MRWNGIHVMEFHFNVIGIRITDFHWHDREGFFMRKLRIFKKEILESFNKVSTKFQETLESYKYLKKKLWKVSRNL